MLASRLSCRDFHVSSSNISKKYCIRKENNSHEHLFSFLVQHLEKNHTLPGNNSKDLREYAVIATQIIMDIKYNANIAQDEKNNPKLMEIQKKIWGNCQ